MSNIERCGFVGDSSKLRRVDGNWAFLDFDVTDLLSSTELRQFQEETGLQKSPVTVVLPDQWADSWPESPAQNQVVVAFLHGLGGGRDSWGVGNAPTQSERSFVLQVLRSIESLGKQALGLVLAGLGRDGGNLSSAVGAGGITPQHYSRQLEFSLRHLNLLQCDKIIGIGHSLGAAALWEFAGRNSSDSSPQARSRDSRLDVSVVAISPVRAIAQSRFLTVGCQIAGKGLDLLLRPLVGLWRFSSRRLSDFVATASALKGLGRQVPFSGSLAGVKGLVLIGERDWIARTGLVRDLRRASCQWPVAQLAGLGHNLLWHPATVRALTNHIPALL